ALDTLPRSSAAGGVTGSPGAGSSALPGVLVCPAHRNRHLPGDHRAVAGAAEAVPNRVISYAWIRDPGMLPASSDSGDRHVVGGAPCTARSRAALAIALPLTP